MNPKNTLHDTGHPLQIGVVCPRSGQTMTVLTLPITEKAKGSAALPCQGIRCLLCFVAKRPPRRKNRHRESQKGSCTRNRPQYCSPLLGDKSFWNIFGNAPQSRAASSPRCIGHHSIAMPVWSSNFLRPRVTITPILVACWITDWRSSLTRSRSVSRICFLSALHPRTSSAGRSLDSRRGIRSDAARRRQDRGRSICRI